MVAVGVEDYYDGKSILITGGSGFVGKVLLEKLLYSCSGIDKIYLLMRDKGNLCGQQRLNGLLEKPLFARLKREKPHAFKKVFLVNGDATRKNLGLSNEDEDLLINEISLVFHLAATTRFNESIEATFNINVNGTMQLLNLCKRMKNIQRFVYVSTAYSNADLPVIDEVVYSAPISLDALRKRLIVGLSDDEVNKLINGKPNIYTFTKAIAENYIKDNHGHVPSVIIRPSIVTASSTEPLVGWIDNWAGAPSLVLAVSQGFHCVLLGKFSNILDCIPVDYVTNLTIVAAATSSNNSQDVPVYNSCSSELNPVSIGALGQHIAEYGVTIKTYCHPKSRLVMSTSRSKMSLISMFQQVLPLYLADIGRSLKGNEKKYMKMIKRVLLVQKVLEPFTSNSWVIRAQNTRALSESLSSSDKAIFPFNPEDIVWSEYIPVYCSGLKQFMQKS